MRQPNFSMEAELLSTGTAYERTGSSSDDGEWAQIACPFHDDADPSCGVNLKTNGFACQACGEKGSGVKLLARIRGITEDEQRADLVARYGDDPSDEVVQPEFVAEYQLHLQVKGASQSQLLAKLSARGITEAMLREYRIGYDPKTKRITVPIYGAGGDCIAIKGYLPGAPSKDKFKKLHGSKGAKLFPMAQLGYDRIVVCGGEFKAIYVASLLNEHGIGAICSTGGEKSKAWLRDHLMTMDGKKVWVMLDIDDTGEKASRDLATLMTLYAESVHRVEIPLDPKEYPHGDVNDWKPSAHTLLRFLEETPRWNPPLVEARNWGGSEEPVAVTLHEAYGSEHSGDRWLVEGVVIGSIAGTSFQVPKTVCTSCAKDQGFACAGCQLYQVDNAVVDVPPESPGILNMVGCRDEKALREAVKLSLNVAKSCTSFDFRTIEHQDAQDILVTDQRTAVKSQYPAVFVGRGLELNHEYRITGRTHPRMHSLRATACISRAEMDGHSLLSFELTEANAEELKQFQPVEWTLESLTEKLDSLYSDLENNVTNIYQRRGMHVAIDLAYHSVLQFSFDDQPTKGWVEVLVIGDTGQAKTHACDRFREFYGLGDKLDCERISTVGLACTTQQHDGKWFTTMGKFPIMDGQLLTLEELKDAPTDVFARITEMRSSGKMISDKAGDHIEAPARVRLIVNSNMRSKLEISELRYGVSAVLDVIPDPADVRRFDLTLILAAGEVDEAEVNRPRSEREAVPHRFGKAMCRNLVLWAWRRGPKHVQFEPTATEAIMREASRLSSKYDSSVPLCDGGTMRLKLARLSTALAARTFSTDEQHEVVIVRPCHVQYVVRYIESVYDAPAFGFDEYSRSKQVGRVLRNPEKLEAAILAAPCSAQLIECLLNADAGFSRDDLSDWGMMDDGATRLLSSLMASSGAVERNHKTRLYVKTGAFVRFLKQLAASGKASDNVPDYINNKEY